MRRNLISVTGIALVLVGSSGAGPTASAGRSTHCRFTKEVVLSPGFSMTPTSGIFTTNGENGTIECDGPVAGHQPTGGGSIGTDGRYGTDGSDTCTSGTEGTGVDTLTIPTADGPRTLVAAYRFTAGDPPKKGDGLIAGHFDGERFTGTFEAMPLKGDCLTSPVTVLRVVGEGVLH